MNVSNPDIYGENKRKKGSVRRTNEATARGLMHAHKRKINLCIYMYIVYNIYIYNIRGKEGEKIRWKAKRHYELLLQV